MISHRHRTVFVHIPKCGGQSVEQAFLTDLGLTWADRDVLMLMPKPKGRLGPPRLAHLSAAQYLTGGYVSAEQWRDYFTFALVRDPAARAVSHFNYERPVDDLHGYVQDWLPRQFDAGLGARFGFVRPQVDFLTGPDGARAVDATYRLEDIRAHWPEVQSRAGLTQPLPHRNASARGAVPADLTTDDLSVLARLYAPDYTAFGYDPARPRRATGGAWSRLWRRRAPVTAARQR